MNLSSLKTINLKLLIDRSIRAAKLDAKLYEELADDEAALVQSIIVVIISSLAAGIGIIGKANILGVILAPILTLLSWALWIYLTFFIANQTLPAFQTKLPFSFFLRLAGFAASAGILRVIGIIPWIWITHFAFFIAAAWMLVALIIAVKNTYHYQSWPKVILVCVGSWVAHFVILIVFSDLVLRLSGVLSK